MRPRWVWAGTGLALVGIVLLGAAVASVSWGAAAVGLTMLLAGTTIGWLSGGYYHAHTGQEAGSEIQAVLRDETRYGVAPGDQVGSPEVHSRAREIDRGVRRRIEATVRAPRPAVGRLAAVVVLLVALFLWTSQWGLYPIGEAPEANKTRALGVAIVVAAAALRVLTGHGRHPVAAGVTIVAGAVLVVLGAVADHETTATAAAEIVSGALVCLCGVAFATSREQRRS